MNIREKITKLLYSKLGIVLSLSLNLILLYIAFRAAKVLLSKSPLDPLLLFAFIFLLGKVAFSVIINIKRYKKITTE